MASIKHGKDAILQSKLFSWAQPLEVYILRMRKTFPHGLLVLPIFFGFTIVRDLLPNCPPLYALAMNLMLQLLIMNCRKRLLST